MKTYVIDASIVLTALIDKKNNAVLFLKQIVTAAKKKEAKIYTTAFMLLEVANGTRFSLPDKASAILIYEELLKLPISYFSLNQDQIRNILDLSYDLKTTVYDTSYHHLARLLDGVFITCDKDYYRKARKIGHIELI